LSGIREKTLSFEEAREWMGKTNSMMPFQEEEKNHE